MAVVHDDPSFAVMHGHGLRHVAKSHSVSPEKDFVLNPVIQRIIIGKSGIPILEITLVQNKKSVARSVKIFRIITVIPFHTPCQKRHDANCHQDFSKRIHDSADITIFKAISGTALLIYRPGDV